MPTGFLTSARDYRAPTALIAIALVVLQAVAAGLSTAHAAARLALNAPEAGIICYGAGGALDPGSTAPGTDKELPACCVYCAAAAPPFLPARAPVAVPIEPGRGCAASSIYDLSVLVAPRAVRDGDAQAPPSLV